MAEKIVVGFDGSDQGRDALALAVWLAGNSDVELVAVDVYEQDNLRIALPGWSEWEHYLREDAEETLAEAKTLVPGSTKLTSKAVRANSEAQGLYELSKRLGADLIVIGSSHRSRLAEVWTGSVGDRLLHGAPCPVAVAPNGFRNRTHRGPWTVMVGYDGLPEAKRALAGAADIARRVGSGLHLLAIAKPPSNVMSKGESTAGIKDLKRAIEEDMKRRLDEAVEELPDELEVEVTLASGDPAAELSRAGEEAGLLVIGSRGYGPLRSVLLGSVSSRLVHEAPCPVLVFPRGVEETETSDRPIQAKAVAV
jgi:nucleotide-binding universal stress UspA family protein